MGGAETTKPARGRALVGGRTDPRQNVLDSANEHGRLGQCISAISVTRLRSDSKGAGLANCLPTRWLDGTAVLAGSNLTAAAPRRRRRHHAAERSTWRRSGLAAGRRRPRLDRGLAPVTARDGRGRQDDKAGQAS